MLVRYEELDILPEKLFFYLTAEIVMSKTITSNERPNGQSEHCHLIIALKTQTSCIKSLENTILQDALGRYVALLRPTVMVVVGTVSPARQACIYSRSGSCLPVRRLSRTGEESAC